MAALSTEVLRDARARTANLQAQLTRRDLDALVVSSEANFTYLSGHSTPSWAITSRPLAILLTPASATAIVGTGDAATFAAVCPHLRVRAYRDPLLRCDNGFAYADFAAAVEDVVVELAGDRPTRRIGIEGSVPSAAGLPWSSLRTIAARLDAELIDSSALLWRHRLVKSHSELDRLRAVAGRLEEAYDRFAAVAHVGMTERQLRGLIVAAAARSGVDRIGYSIAVLGDRLASAQPSERRWRHGELLLLDTCVCLDGYWADFCRLFAGGEPTVTQREGYAALIAALDAGRVACAPGRPVSAVARAVTARLPAGEEGAAAEIGRVGHGIGLELAEPPSVFDGDPTRLEPGMTLTIEPSGGFACGHMEAEEMVMVTESGCERLHRGFPRELPVIS